jgi:hypothetical protein
MMVTEAGLEAGAPSFGMPVSTDTMRVPPHRDRRFHAIVITDSTPS